MISGSYYALRDISNFKDIVNENRILRENIDNLERQILNFRELHRENERLRKLLDFTKSKGHKFIPSMVIAREPFGYRAAVIIDKGKNNNVRKDMIVISGNGLVGRVCESGWNISRVILITDSDSVVSGIVQRTRDEGAVVGTNSGLIMKYLDLGCDIKEGDVVITSGFSGIFEKGILIGVVDSVNRDASGLYLNAAVRPEVEMMKLEEVLVMR